MRVRRWSVVLPLMVGLLAGACSDGAGSPEVATAAAPGAAPSSPAAAPGAPADDPVRRELEFVACMRRAGVDMPDPLPGDTSGRSALLHAIDDLGMGLDNRFQEVLDSCAAYLPPGSAPTPPAPDDVEKLRRYAQCMRDNGVTDMADPDPVTGQLNHWILQGDKVAEAAVEKCRNLLPPAPTAGPLAEPKP